MSEALDKIVVNNIPYNIITLDFETFYGKEYTLSGKMNTSEYIRDDRFHAHGVAIKEGTNDTQWYSGENIAKKLKSINWTDKAVIAHNAAFDGFILSEVYGIIPGFYLDTLSMARAAHGHHTRHNLDTIAKLHGLKGKVKGQALVNTRDKLVLTDEETEALGAYAKDDVDDTFTIFWKMYPYIPDDEFRLIDLTMRMFCDPVLEIDIPRVQAELDNEVGAKLAAINASGASIDDLMSNNKFARLIEATGTECPLKVSPSTGKMTYAFARSDLDFKALMENGSEQVKALCEARIKVKSTIGETRAARFLEAGKDGHKLPILLNYSGAHTHRWSGGNKLNLQNLKRGGELRRSILAPPGHVIVVADSAQIEARVLAWLANQEDIVKAFANKEDVYKMMASAIYGVAVADINKDQRFVGKVCVLGLGYGMGPQKLQLTLAQGAMGPIVDLTEDECRRIVTIYRNKNWCIKQLWRDMDQIINCMTVGIEGEKDPISYGKGFIRLPNDLFLQYYGLHGNVETYRDNLQITETTYLTRMGRSKLYGGLLTENVVQALARVIIGEQMLKIHDAGYRVVTSTHDEIVCVVPETQADQCLADMLDIMSVEPEWAREAFELGLPLSAEGGWAYNYSK